MAVCVNIHLFQYLKTTDLLIQNSPVLPLGVLQLPMVFLQVFGEGSEVLPQKILERLLFLCADDLTRRKRKTKLLSGQFHLARNQTGDIVSTVLTEADDHRHVRVRLTVGADDVLQLLVNKRETFFVCEEAHDGKLSDEAQVCAELAHVRRLFFLPRLKVLLPRL